MSFQKDFLWCVGGAAAQQDGGYSDGGKGLNIWDTLSEGHIKNNDTCHIACKSLRLNLSKRTTIRIARLTPTNSPIM